MRLVAPSPTTASSAAGAPGSRQTVATLTAPSTPIEAWQRWGMKVRVEIEVEAGSGFFEVKRSALLRTARKIFDGTVFVPAALWDGRRS